MTEVVPAGTKCDADCVTWAQTRITILSAMLPVFLCGHHEHEFTKAVKKETSFESETECNPLRA